MRYAGIDVCTYCGGAHARSRCPWPAPYDFNERGITMRNEKESFNWPLLVAITISAALVAGAAVSVYLKWVAP